MWTPVTGGALFEAPWIKYNNYLLSEYAKKPPWGRLASLRKDHQNAVDFKTKLDAFLRKTNIYDPAVEMQQAYEITTLQPIVDIFVLKHLDWEAFFRANYTTMTLKGILIRDCRVSLASTLTSMLPP